MPTKRINFLLLVFSCIFLFSCKGCKPSPVKPVQVTAMSGIVFQNAGGTLDSIDIRWSSNFQMFYGGSGYANFRIDTTNLVMAYSGATQIALSHVYCSDASNSTLLNTLSCNYNGDGSFYGFSNVNQSNTSNFSNISYDLIGYPNSVIASDSSSSIAVTYVISNTMDTVNFRRLTSSTISYYRNNPITGIDSSEKCVLTYDTMQTGNYANINMTDIFNFPTIWMLECTHPNGFAQYGDLGTFFATSQFSMKVLPGDVANVVFYPVTTVAYFINGMITKTYSFSYKLNAQGNIIQKTITDNAGNSTNIFYRYKLYDYM